MFIDSNRLISFMGKLNDIIKSDSIYYLKVYSTKSSLYKNYISHISISSSNFSELKDLLKLNHHSDEGCFIFRVSKIISVTPEIKPEHDSEDGSSYSYLEYDLDKILVIFKGDLVDFYLKEEELPYQYNPYNPNQ